MSQAWSRPSTPAPPRRNPAPIAANDDTRDVAASHPLLDALHEALAIAAMATMILLPIAAAAYFTRPL